jgi:hypothetical protein
MGLQGTSKDWQSDMLEHLNNFTSQGVIKVKWQSSNDQHVCPQCAARNSKIYTIAEVKKELKGKFCQPGDPDDRCRCAFTAVEFKKSPPKPKGRRKRKSKKKCRSQWHCGINYLRSNVFCLLGAVFLNTISKKHRNCSKSDGYHVIAWRNDEAIFWLPYKSCNGFAQIIRLPRYARNDD